jgi:hypothetical protein
LRFCSRIQGHFFSFLVPATSQLGSIPSGQIDAMSLCV